MKFNKDDKLMGFHQNVTGVYLKSGTVSEIITGNAYNHDRYILGKDGVLHDKEAVKFDGLKFKQAQVFIEEAEKLEEQARDKRMQARQTIYEDSK